MQINLILEYQKNKIIVKAFVQQKLFFVLLNIPILYDIFTIPFACFLPTLSIATSN
jgi:hypothetical protein